MALIVILAIVLIIVKPFGGKENPTTNNPATTDQPVESVEPGSTVDPTVADPNVTAQSQPTDLAAALGSEDSTLEGLTAEQMVQVDNLSINTELSSEWMNVLLLGTDERWINTSARTDSMLICSINTTTGEVKLTSIMRDLAVEFDDIGQYNGTFRINSANYFGGPELAMKTVNECFDMNIQYYVTVNFFGFQKIAQKLGGIEIDITEEEMEQINKLIREQYKLAYYGGIDETDQENEYLETFGESTHLNGRQTLAYARIRKIDNDYMRSERQRLVLTKLMGKLKERNPLEIASLATSMSDQFRTNMKIEDIITVALKVMSSDIADVDTFRLPVVGTYKEERRNEQDMLYGCDWSSNFTQLYNFIYE